MGRFAIRILTLAMFVMALAAAPLVTKVHANPDSDAPPPSSTKSKAKKKTKKASDKPVKKKSSKKEDVSNILVEDQQPNESSGHDQYDPI